MATEAATLSLRGISGKGLGAPVLLVMMLAMVIIPLPPIALDMFFTFNIKYNYVFKKGETDAQSYFTLRFGISDIW